MATVIKVGETIPEGIFKYVPYSPDLENGVSWIQLHRRKTKNWLAFCHGYKSWDAEFVSSNICYRHANTSHLNQLAIPLSTNEWKGKKVVLLSVPGAFTVSTFKKIYLKKQSVIAAIQPTCHVNHLPSYLQKYDEFVAKGADVVAVLAANDPFVMSGWAGVEGLKDKVINVHFFFVLYHEVIAWGRFLLSQTPMRSGPNNLD